MDFIGKSGIVVGGFGGIGIETCKILLRRGISNLAVFDWNEHDDKLELLRSCNENCLVKFWKIDITKKAGCENAFESVVSEFGAIDLVINSVGIVDELNPERSVDTNLLGTININLLAIRYMSQENENGRGGTVLTISSVFGLEPCESYPIYAATKHGIIGFVRSLGTEDLYKRTGVKLVVVCPGFTSPSMPSSMPDAIFPYMPVGSPDDRFQPVEYCAHYVIETIEQAESESGSIWIIDNSELTKVTPIKYFFPPPTQ